MTAPACTSAPTRTRSLVPTITRAPAPAPDLTRSLAPAPAPVSDNAPAPHVLAVIPARGGSKGVPGKNLAPVGGVPLVGRAAAACADARRVTGVVVTTDDAGIAEAARAAGAQVVRRPSAIAGDTATSETAVLHALDAYEAMCGAAVDVVLLVQCTSPFVTGAEIDAVAAAVLDGGADSALTAAPFHGFVWRSTTAATTAPATTTVATATDTATTDGTTTVAVSTATTATATTTTAAGATTTDPTGGTGVNHDSSCRPRRQDRPEELLETGAAYAMRVDGFRRTGHRFFGRTALVPVDPARVLEIDEPADLRRAQALAPLFDATPATVPAPRPTAPRTHRSP